MEKTSSPEAGKTEPVEKCSVAGDASLAEVSTAAAVKDTDSAPTADVLSADKELERLPSDIDASEKISPAAGLGCDNKEETFQAAPASDESKEAAEAVANDRHLADDAESGSSGSDAEAAVADKPVKTQLKYTYAVGKQSQTFLYRTVLVLCHGFQSHYILQGWVGCKFTLVVLYNCAPDLDMDVHM